MSLKPYRDDIQRITDYVIRLVSCHHHFNLEELQGEMTDEARVLCIEIPKLLAQLEAKESKTQ